MPHTFTRRTVFSSLGLMMVASARVANSRAATVPRPLKLLALGDSLTAGYGVAHADGFVVRLQAALDAAQANVRVLDGGVSGDTSTDALARLDWVLGDNPDAALVELGGNDALRGLDPARMEANLRAIIGKLQARHIPVMVSGMLAPPNMGAAYGQQFSDVFARISRIPGIFYDPFFLAGVAGHPDLQQADRIHPNPKGVLVIVARVMPMIRQLLVAARQGD